MGKAVNAPEKVKLFCGLIAVSTDMMKSATQKLVEKYGSIDNESELVSFDYTDYYEREMGGHLVRKWVSFEDMICQEEIAGIKVYTNSLEDVFASESKRRINIDPGFMALSKIVLASTKDFSHRIYLSSGIYAEITLLYKKGAFHPLEWTYPDYKSQAAADFFVKAREMYYSQIK